MGLTRRVGVVLACAGAVLCILAASAGAVVIHKPDGQFVSVIPRAGVAPASIPGSPRTPAAQRERFAANGNMDYHGGPVIHSSAPILVFWDPANTIPSSSRLLLERYFADVAADSGKASNVYGTIRQYTDGSGFPDYKQAFAASQVINDTQQYPSQDLANCPNTSATFPVCISDMQLQGELARLTRTEGLPTGTAANAPIYFVVTPTNVNICADAKDCADNIFCAYHSSFSTNTGNVLYAAIPTLVLGPGQNVKSCQFDGNTPVQEPNGDGADVVVSYMSHEDNETLTDPVGTGWWDTNTGNEIGDRCAFTGTFDPANGFNPNAFLPTLGGIAPAGTLFDQQINGHPYYIQSEWSNGDVNCDLRPSPGSVSASFLAPAAGASGAALTFDPSASTSTQGYSSVTWSFGDGSVPRFATGGPPVATTHTFATPGLYTVTLTLVDTFGNLATAIHQVLVGSPPTAAFSASPSRVGVGSPESFNARGSSDPNAGGSIASYSWSFGDGSAGSGASPSHVYSGAGTYTVTLTVTERFGLSSAPVAHQVTVDEPPVARLSVTSAPPEAGVPVGFRGSSSRDPDGAVRSYAWSYGDGAHASGAAVKHTYRKPGSYTVTLTVTDSAGLRASSSTTVLVQARVTAVSVQTRNGHRVLLVSTNGPGVVSYGKVSVHLSRAGAARFDLPLNSSQENALAQTGKLSLSLSIKFKPTVGSAEKTQQKLTVRQ